MENQNMEQRTVSPLPQRPYGAPVKVDTTFESIQKMLMTFVFILTICMFSYWGYQAVMYILSLGFNVNTEFTP